jgi:hypothetical protein
MVENPIDFITNQITEGINNAVDALEDKSLMVVSATFHSNLTMNIPGFLAAEPLISVTNDITIVIGPNPYKENQNP